PAHALLRAPSRPAPAGRLLPRREPVGHEEFLALYGPRRRGGEALVRAVEAAGLSGRGGAGFPTWRKLSAVAARGGAVVVGNGAEGEPLSRKDETLMWLNPHLVIDGALLAAETVGASRVILTAARGTLAGAALRAALDERRAAAGVEVALVPDRFVAGEESALVHHLNGGEAKPTFTPPRPFERGVGGRPTLVQNVETLANLA